VATFAPLLAKAHLSRIIFVSSALGGITYRSDAAHTWDAIQFLPYRASKAALNMLAAGYAQKFRERGWKVNTVCPGYVKTRMVNFAGHISTEEAMTQPIKMCTLGEDGETLDVYGRQWRGASVGIWKGTDECEHLQLSLHE
jgi:NAD(P)-dependent dehydrogenase (short-subunit alcohol dehydrogenase family)